MKNLLITLFLISTVIATGCKKDEKSAPNISGTYEVNCVRKDPQTGHNSPYPDLTWEVVNVGGNTFRADNLHPSGTGYAPRPFQQLTFEADGDGIIDIDQTYYKGTGSHSKTGMFWAFTEFLPSYQYNWDCTCIKK